MKFIAVPNQTQGPLIPLAATVHFNDQLCLIRSLSFPGQMKDAASHAHRWAEIPVSSALVQEAKRIEYGAFAGRIGTDKQVKSVHLDLNVAQASIVTRLELH